MSGVPGPAGTAVSAADAADAAGPVVVREQLLGTNEAVTGVVLTFNESLNPATAQNVDAYLILKKIHTKDSGDEGGLFSIPFTDNSGGGTSTTVRKIRFDAAVYDDATHTVTLTPHKTFVAGKRFRQLRVIGKGANAITDVAGNPLDGKADGTSGDNALIKFKPRHGRHLSLKDADGDRMTVKLTGPGRIVSLTHRKGNADPLIFVENSVAGQSVLSGTVKPGPHGDGVFDVAQVTGTATAQATFLTDPAFRIGMTQP